LDDPNAEVFVISADGTDFKSWEKSMRRCLMTEANLRKIILMEA
jgi:hypothetical protein